MLFRVLLALVAAVAFAAPARTVTLADQGRTGVTIVLARHATAAEQKAAQELAAYLRRISGAEFPVRSESQANPEGSHIFVGDTVFAKTQSLAAEKLEAEEWAIQTYGKDLVILGGTPRGTIYGAYHFLEDAGEFRWRLTNAAHATDGFRAALAGWHEALDAKAFQQEQAAAHGVTTALVLLNGVFVGTVVVSVFGFLVSIINAGLLW